MKTVRDDDGTPYVLLKRSDEASLVRDPTTGNECYVRNDRLETTDQSVLETAASGVSAPVRVLVTAVHDEQTLGLLVELADRGPTPVRTLLSETGLCESDLHGTVTVLTAAGLLEETTIAGECGYRVTECCHDALDIVRADGDEQEEQEE